MHRVKDWDFVKAQFALSGTWLLTLKPYADALVSVLQVVAVLLAIAYAGYKLYQRVKKDRQEDRREAAPWHNRRK